MMTKHRRGKENDKTRARKLPRENVAHDLVKLYGFGWTVDGIK